MEIPDPPVSSHLFLIRLWPAGGGAEPAQWAGKVQHVASGEAHYFRDWPALIDLLLAILPTPLPDASSGPLASAPERPADTAEDGECDPR